jgi:hypothetical protein
MISLILVGFFVLLDGRWANALLAEVAGNIKKAFAAAGSPDAECAAPSATPRASP